MKILFCQKVGLIAGSETYLLKILPALKARNVKVSFLALYSKASEKDTLAFLQRLDLLGIPHERIQADGLASLPALFKIAKCIKRGAYDIVHSHLIHADFFMSMVKRLFLRSMVLVSTKHGYEEKYIDKFGFDAARKEINLYYIICKFSEQYINRSFSISKGLHDLFCRLTICSSKGHDIIPYGFDFDDNYAFCPEYRFGRQQLVIIGRLKSFKGHRFAFKAVAILKRKYPEIKLVVVGWGDAEQSLKALVEKLQLQSNVVFIGPSKEARNYMHTSDIVLVPSISEGFGVVILEAMSVCRPVIAFDVSAPNEILEDQISGVLIKPYDTSLLAEGIASLLDREDVRVRIAARALERLRSHYSLDIMTENTIKFYRAVLS